MSCAAAFITDWASRLLEAICKLCKCSLLQVDYGRGTKAAGYYVQYPSGLFPAPLPQTSDYGRMPDVETLFHCVGILFAKCIQVAIHESFNLVFVY